MRQRSGSHRGALLDRITRRFQGVRSFRYTTCRRSGPSSTSGSSKSSAGSVVIPIRRITACERRFRAMVTATISGRPMVSKPYCQRCHGRLGGVTVTPRGPRQPPPEFDSGERHPVVHGGQTREADELAGRSDIHGPEAKAVVIQVVLEVQNPGGGLLEGQQRSEELPDLRVGVHRRPRREIGFPPAAHDQSLGADLYHPVSLFWTGSERARPERTWTNPLEARAASAAPASGNDTRAETGGGSLPLVLRPLELRRAA